MITGDGIALTSIRHPRPNTWKVTMVFRKRRRPTTTNPVMWKRRSVIWTMPGATDIEAIAKAVNQLPAEAKERLLSIAAVADG